MIHIHYWTPTLGFERYTKWPQDVVWDKGSVTVHQGGTHVMGEIVCVKASLVISMYHCEGVGAPLLMQCLPLFS